MLEHLLLGGYTKKNGQGVYQAELDTATEKLSTPELLIKVDNPTYIARSKKNVLYTVAKQGDQGGVAAFDLNQSQPTELNRVLAAGSPPAYVSVDESRQLVYAANYHKGEINVYKIQNDGQLQLADTVGHTGKGPKPEQDSAHVHYTDLTPDGRLIVCDLGMDQVTVYNVSPDGRLDLASTYQSQPGFGPRHVAFHPTEPIAYLVGELGSAVTVLNYDSTTGSLTGLETDSTVPEHWEDFNGAAAIRVSSDGRFVYASNRGHNSLAVFKTVDQGKKLELIQRISTEGDFPRDFNLDPSEHFVVAANQKTDNLTLYRRNPATGFLTMIQKDVVSPESVCVLFTK